MVITTYDTLCLYHRASFAKRSPSLEGGDFCGSTWFLLLHPTNALLVEVCETKIITEGSTEVYFVSWKIICQSPPLKLPKQGSTAVVFVSTVFVIYPRFCVRAPPDPPKRW